MGDSGYTGVHKREENQGLAVDWQVAMKTGQRRKLAPGSPAALREKAKASIRAKSLRPSPIGGGTPLSGRKEAIRLRQGALPGPGQEPGAHGAAAGAVHPEACPDPSCWLTQGSVGPNPSFDPKTGPIPDENQEKGHQIGEPGAFWTFRPVEKPNAHQLFRGPLDLC